MSLNIRHPKGLQIAKDLVAHCDIVAEGFSPKVLDRLGLGYDVLRSIRPDIIYIQQSGMGSHGTYGRLRTVGPVAAAFAGTSEMSGLPEPAMPVGWGYSFLDWMGAYGYASAILSALIYRQQTGKGQWIDSSQCEAGIALTAVPVLDSEANGRIWQRIGNRSPYKPAAPHGAYACQGTDRWIAIAAFDDAQWQGLLSVLGNPAVLQDRRFATLNARLAHQDNLDAAITRLTKGCSDYDLMQRLQQAGVPAGVCQTAADKYDRDVQLRNSGWLTEVTGTEIGTWPVIEIPAKLSATPTHAGGPTGRGAPCYGEDNSLLLSSLLGFSAGEIEQLAEEGVI
jgi:crotonobetainyl-CoA:carnitine CoA-transferase CaiB-like acyl-CoA transferase